MVTEALVLAPLALAVVLVVSGVAKLRDPAAAQAAFTALRVPDVLAAPWIRRAVPIVEVALGALLVALPGAFRVAAAVAAVGLFVAYTVLIVRAWRAPEAVDCNCFGASSSVVTGWTVARNGLLLAGASASVWDAAVADLPPVLRLADAGVLAWVAGAALVALLVATIVHRPDAAASPLAAVSSGDEDEAGGEYLRAPIPYGTLQRPDGVEVHLHDLARSRAVLLVWVSPTCGSCTPVIERLPAWIRDLAVLDVVVAVRPEQREPLLGRGFDEAMLLDVDSRLLGLFRAQGTPSAVLLGADGLIAGGPVSGSPAIEHFVEQIQAQLAPEPLSEGSAP